MKIKLFILGFSFFTIYFLPAQELAFPPKINLFQYTASISQRPLYGFPNARIWGWSNNGKVAYSIETEVDGRGGQKIDFVVFDLISDETIFELKMDSFDHNDVEDEILYNLFRSDIANAFVCGYFLSPFENRALVVVAEEHGYLKEQN
ncbi:MAG: hypothetical protein FWG29_08520 [Treponema sp.]|nr:hypothetical protein [Treponema sp.]